MHKFTRMPRAKIMYISHCIPYIHFQFSDLSLINPEISPYASVVNTTPVSKLISIIRCTYYMFK